MYILYIHTIDYYSERVWRKGNPPTLLVGMQIAAASMENSIEIPLETKNREFPLWRCGLMIQLVSMLLPVQYLPRAVG